MPANETAYSELKSKNYIRMLTAYAAVVDLMGSGGLTRVYEDPNETIIIRTINCCTSAMREEDASFVREVVAEIIRATLISKEEAITCLDYLLSSIDATWQYSNEQKKNGIARQPSEMATYAFILYTSYCWYRDGFPTIQIGHKMAAAFAVTTPKVQLESIKAPFKSFLVELPDHLLPTEDGSYWKGVQCIDMCEIGHPAWSFRLLADSGLYITLNGTQLDGLKKSLQTSATLAEMTATSSEIAITICINIMLWLTNQGEIREVGRGHQNWNTKKTTSGYRNGEPPSARIFRVVGDVKHDFRKDVSSYLQGKSHKLTVQFMVCGHWTHQVHGPRNSLRRRQFIAPYWKGDVDAPIALRNHNMGEPEK